MVNGMTKEMELEKKEEEGLNLADYLFMFLSHWYWFVASVVVAMVIAVYYIMSTTPIYTTSTQLLIRDDKNSKGASTSIQDFSDLSLIKSNTNIKNENSDNQCAYHDAGNSKAPASGFADGC